jgi:hypothetical protein
LEGCPAAVCSPLCSAHSWAAVPRAPWPETSWWEFGWPAWPPQPLAHAGAHPR